MSEEEIKKIFSNNLVNYLEMRGKSQADLSRFMGVSTATVSDWCNSKKLPRMDKIQSICNYLMIEKSDLLEEKRKSYNRLEPILIVDESNSMSDDFSKKSKEIRASINATNAFRPFPNQDMVKISDEAKDVAVRFDSAPDFVKKAIQTLLESQKPDL